MCKLSVKRLIALLGVAGLALGSVDGAVPVYQETGGRVVVEAENFSAKKDDLNDPFPADPPHHWHRVPADDGVDTAGDSGDPAYTNPRGAGYIQSLPNSGDNHNNNDRATTAPSVDYYVDITTVGTYQLWLRWSGYSGDSDSIYAEILEVPTPNWYRYGDGGNPDDGDFATKTGGGGQGWDGIGNPNDTGGGGSEVPAVFNITTPGTYTIRVSMREDASAVDALILQLQSLAAPTDPGPAESGLSSAYVIILEQPKSVVASIGQTATFSVSAQGAAAVSYQWQRKAPGGTVFTDIAGATGTSFVTPTATEAMNGTEYRAVVSSGGRTATSLVAALVTDATPPGVVSATGGAGQNSVQIQFTEAVDQATAQAAGNYTIAGLAVSAAKLDATGRSVTLTTANQTAGTAYTVTVAGVKDRFNNTGGGTAGFQGATPIANRLLARIYRGIGGTAVLNLTQSPLYPGSPTQVLLYDDFDPFDGNTGDVLGDNYGGEVTGFFIPQATGLHKFYIRSDDASELWLSTDSNPANIRRIAVQTGCCNAFTDAEGTLSSEPINLTAGQKYYLLMYWKEGAGGDFVQAGVLGPNDGDINDASAVVPIPGDLLGTAFDRNVSLAITQQPGNAAAGVGTSATFTVAYNANSVFGSGAAVRWQRAAAGSTTFTDLVGTSGPSLTLPFVAPSDNNAQYRAVITVGSSESPFGILGTVNSSAATLTVTGSDSTPPLLAALEGSASRVTLVFSEPLDTASAQTAGNYTISGVTVSSATLISGPNQAAVVRLALTGANAGTTYNLTINNVKDLSNNSIASTTRPFTPLHVLESFNVAGTPDGLSLVGSAVILPAGAGGNGSGVLQLTANAGSLQGTVVLADPLNGNEATRFTAIFKLFIGNGSGNAADGFSFNIASDLTPETSTGEEGTGGGLTIALDTYDNGGGEAPAFTVKYQGSELDNQVVPKVRLVNNRWVEVVIKVDADGTLDVEHDLIKVYDNFEIPGWAPIAGPVIALGARTGGEFATHQLDDIAVLYNGTLARNEPPTVTLTSPTAGQTFAAGATVTIQAEARDPEGAILKVEFFANGQKLGEDATAPYSLTIPSVPAGVYLVSARVTDGQNVSVSTASATKAIVGNPPQILFVHASAGPNASDSALMDYLITQGYNPVAIGATDSTTEDATGKVLIITSSTVASGEVGDKFVMVTVPVLNWEAALQDNYLFTLNTDGTDRGVTAGQTQLEITDPAHPIAGGLTGRVTVADPGVDFSWGFPVLEAKRIGTLTDGTGRVGLYAYNPGDLLLDGATRAAGRRVHVPGGDNTYVGLNATGKQLWHNAIDWAIKGSSTAPTQPTISIARAANGQVTVSSSDGGTVQATGSLTPPITWTAVGPAPQTVAGGPGHRYFRILK